MPKLTRVWGRIKTGTYTGDGSISQAITGIGFRPKLLHIYQKLATEGTMYSFTTSDQHLIGYAESHYDTGNFLYDNRITSLDADGFTVSDDNQDLHPNKAGSTYSYVAFG